MCPWNGPKLVRLTREAGYRPRASRPRERPGAGSGAARQASDPDSGGTAAGFPAAASIPGPAGPSLPDLLAMDDAAWDEFSRGSAIRRARRAGFLRNVAVALGNWGSAEAVPALVRALEDAEPLVRGHAAWALGRIGTAAAREALEGRLPLEQHAFVLGEVNLALAQPG